MKSGGSHFIFHPLFCVGINLYMGNAIRFRWGSKPYFPSITALQLGTVAACKHRSPRLNGGIICTLSPFLSAPYIRNANAPSVSARKLTSTQFAASNAIKALLGRILPPCAHSGNLNGAPFVASAAETAYFSFCSPRLPTIACETPHSQLGNFLARALSDCISAPHAVNPWGIISSTVSAGRYAFIA